MRLSRRNPLIVEGLNLVTQHLFSEYFCWAGSAETLLGSACSGEEDTESDFAVMDVLKTGPGEGAGEVTFELIPDGVREQTKHISE